MKKPVPTQSESPFGFDELFFSTTDERGKILFGNEVFVRVSGYPKETLIGAPHSIIRHPDMPRAVFKLLWDTIKSGNPIAAYVKNLSANGSYYWVYAFVFPLRESYLSIRIKPSSDLFKAVQGIYKQTLEVEDKGGMEESVPFLLSQVTGAGFKDYTDFMVRAAFAELTALQKFVHDDASPRNQDAKAAKISAVKTAVSQQLQECFERINSFQSINTYFAGTMEKLKDGFHHLNYIALNMTISAAKFGEVASSLGVVAKEFSKLSEQIQDHLTGLDEFMEILSEAIQKSALKIVALETQMLMVDFFVKESIRKISESDEAFGDMLSNKDNFCSLFREYSDGLNQEITALKKHSSKISVLMADVKKFITGLEVIRQIGAVESARLNETRHTFAHYLEEMQKFIELLQTSNVGIQREVYQINDSAEVIALAASSQAGQVDELFSLVADV